MARNEEAELYGNEEAGGYDNAAQRYRRAAEEALQQLDWCIGYLHGIRKTQLSTRLARNREYIKREMLREQTAPTPAATTNET